MPQPRSLPIRRFLSNPPRLLPTLWLLAASSCAQLSPPPAAIAIDAITGVDTAGPPADTFTPVPSLPDGPAIELANDRGYFPAAWNVVRTAKTRLDICQFEARNSTEGSVGTLIGTAVAAHQRGVKVRVLLDDEIEDNLVVVDYLKKQGIAAKLDNTKTRTHTKLILSEQGFVLGSTNWSTSSIDYNHEANALVRDPAALKAISGYFDKLWNSPGARAKVVPSATAPIAVYGDGDKDGSGYASVVGPLLDKAKTSVVLCTYGMNIDLDSDNPVTKTVLKLKAAIARGVKVQVLMDLTASDAGESFNTASGEILKGWGAQVREDPLTIITHAKFLIVDDVVVMGTNNWGYMGFVLDHEAGLVIRGNAKLLGDLLAYFGKIWAESTPL